MSKFYSLPKIEKATGGMIQKFSNVTHEVVRQLRALNHAVEHMDVFFVHGIHEKLDVETSRQWELFRTSDNPSTMEMLAFLDRHAKALFGANPNGNKEQKSSKENRKRVFDNHNKENLSYNNKRFKSNNFNQIKKEHEQRSDDFTCKICNDKHQVHKCSTFLKMDLAQRNKAVYEHALCKNCLKPNHMEKDCSSGACLRCNVKHNSLLCKENPKNGIVTNVQIQNKLRVKKEIKKQSSKFPGKSNQGNLN